MSPPVPSDGIVPPLAWPTSLDDADRLAWWRECVLAWLDQEEKPVPAPASKKAVAELEQRLGCALPPLLRHYHLQLGVLDLPENLCSVAPARYAAIEPLIHAFPGITDILEGAADADASRALVDELVAFGDYLGNGNLWCFHRRTGQVWYFDHDTAPMLTPMFADVGGYLDALAFKCLLAVHDREDDETLLRQRLGNDIVDKWMY